MNEEENAARYTYRITWSEADLCHVGTCQEFPSLSWLAESPEAALTGIRWLVTECVRDMIAAGEGCPTAANVALSDGLVHLRISAERHRQFAIMAAEQGISVEDLVCNCLIESLPVKD
jgi:predicted RNase H-like HicB family nuclease